MSNLRPFLAVASAVAAVAAAAVIALAAPDPWDVPVPDPIELTLALTESKREYTLYFADEVWEQANGAESIDLPLAQDENDALARARELVTKGDHEGADKALDDLLAKHPANWDAFLTRAASLHARKADADAVVALRTSLVGNRRNPEAWKLAEEIARALGRKVSRPKIDLRGWVRQSDEGEIEVGHVGDDEVSMPWNHYAAARAVYRWEGAFARDFPGEKAYRFTFREQLFAIGVLARAAEGTKKDGAKLPPDLARVLAEKKAGTLAPFAFFAAYPEPLPAAPEKDFDLLRPRLEKYFDEKVLPKR